MGVVRFRTAAQKKKAGAEPWRLRGLLLCPAPTASSAAWCGQLTVIVKLLPLAVALGTAPLTLHVHTLGASLTQERVLSSVSPSAVLIFNCRSHLPAEQCI